MNDDSKTIAILSVVGLMLALILITSIARGL